MSKKTKKQSSWNDDYYSRNSWGSSRSYSYGGSSKYWESWESRFSSYSSLFETREKKMKLRNAFEKIAREEYVPLEIRFSAMDSQSNITKSSRVTINLDDKNIGELKTKKQVREIIQATDRLPENAELKDLTLFSIGMLGTRFFPFAPKADVEAIARQCKQYFSGGVGSIEDLRKLIEANSATQQAMKKKDEKSESMQYGNWTESANIENSPAELVKFLADAIKRKFYFPDTIHKEESIRKGNRINRGFINGTSYKPLIGKTKEAHKKKKLMIVIDGSGSMWCAGKGEFEKFQVRHIAAAFANGIVNSGLFDVKYSIIHHDRGWKNMIGDYQKGIVKGCAAGGEGFENIDETIPESFPKEAEYVVFLTDMCIGTSSQSGMAAFLKRAKKHMILSFQNGGELEGLNVRKIDSFAGMTNALATLLG